MKRIFTLLVIVFAAAAAYAQGFRSISVDGALTGVSVRGTPNELNVVVPQSFDLSAVKINAVPEEGAEIDGALPEDFSVNATQDITLKKADDSGSRTWHLTIRKVKPSPLPLTVEFAATGTTTAAWTPETVGWSYAGIDVSQKAVARYGTATVSFIAAFNEAPANVSYTLNSLSPGFEDGNQFDVDASADGTNWRNIRRFSGTETGVPTTATDYTTDLQTTDRYVRWVYVNRKVNLNLKKFSVAKATNNVSLSRPSVDQPSVFHQPAPGEIVFTQPATKAEVYNLLGKLTAVYDHPSGNISIADGTKGIVIVRATLNDGAIVDRKAVK
jgi:hypothetical protein